MITGSFFPDFSKFEKVEENYNSTYNKYNYANKTPTNNTVLS